GSLSKGRCDRAGNRVSQEAAFHAKTADAPLLLPGTAKPARPAPVSRRRGDDGVGGVASRRCSCDFERSIRALRIGDIEYREISAITEGQGSGRRPHRVLREARGNCLDRILARDSHVQDVACCRAWVAKTGIPVRTADL